MQGEGGGVEVGTKMGLETRREVWWSKRQGRNRTWVKARSRAEGQGSGLRVWVLLGLRVRVLG